MSSFRILTFILHAKPLSRRYPGADQTFLDIKGLQRVAAVAERGLFDFLFLGDGLAANLGNHPSYACRLEPLTLLSALAISTSRIGLVATLLVAFKIPLTILAFELLHGEVPGRPGVRNEGVQRRERDRRGVRTA